LAAPRGIFLEKASLHPYRTPIPPQDNWVSSFLAVVKVLKPSVRDHLSYEIEMIKSNSDRRGPYKNLL